MKEIFIERHKEFLKIAIKDKDKLEECFIEEENLEPYPGEIYKGVVKNIVPAIKCAFIDIGFRKNCYMYMDRRFGNLNIKKGQEILVEILKEDMNNKGPKVTNNISVPGRYCVLDTLTNTLEFSQKITNEEFKQYILAGIKKPDSIGVKIRTNGESATLEDINNEIEELFNIYTEIVKRAEYSIKPGVLYSNGGILGRVLRDNVDDNTSKIITNDEQDYIYIKDYLKGKLELKSEPELYDKSRTLMDYYGIEKEILSLRNNKVTLSCGGYIIIDKTEAMYVVDVNSGKNVKGNSIEKTAFQTDIQAAEEIVRQIKLRNLSGIILVDFIDVDDIKSKNLILEKLRDGFKTDKNKTVVYPFTELNLVQIARRRRGRPLYDYLEEDCNICKGTGKRLKFSYVTSLIRNEVLRIEGENTIRDIYIEIDSYYENAIRGNIINFITEINALDNSVYINFVEKHDYLKVEPLIFANQVRNLQMYKIYG